MKYNECVERQNDNLSLKNEKRGRQSSLFAILENDNFEFS